MSFEESKDYWNNLEPTRKIVFVSHPYSNDPKTNKLKNLELMYKLRDKHPDILFISPLLLFDYLETEEGKREVIMLVCKGLITYVCTDLWCFDDGNSEGCLLEREYAKKAGVPVFILESEEYFK